MANQTESSITVTATPQQVMQVIEDFEAYPQWTGAVKQAKVLRTAEPGGRAQEVRFVLDAGAIKDTYTLAYDWDGVRRVSWTLLEAEILKAMTGSYRLDGNTDGTTRVTYQLAVDVKIPMLGMIKRKAEKVIIDTALKELKKRVEG
jgi:ribosome-associated toxin RatA of RatAB toxin-antitoxin module